MSFSNAKYYLNKLIKVDLTNPLEPYGGCALSSSENLYPISYCNTSYCNSNLIQCYVGTNLNITQQYCPLGINYCQIDYTTLKIPIYSCAFTQVNSIPSIKYCLGSLCNEPIAIECFSGTYLKDFTSISLQTCPYSSKFCKVK